MARMKRVSKARKGSIRGKGSIRRKGKGKRVRRVQSKRMGKKRTKRSSKSSSRSNKRMRRSFIKKSRGRSRRSLRRMRGGLRTPKYQYWKEKDATIRDAQRKLAIEADSTSGFGGILKWEKSLAKIEDLYVRTLRESVKKPHLAEMAEGHHSTLMRHRDQWPLGRRGLSGKEQWIDPKDVYTK